MIIHDHALQLLQFKLTKGQPVLLGFNELDLTMGLVEKGKIVNMDAFRTVLETLFLEASPNSIKTRELYINIPYSLLYTYVEDFSQKTEKDIAMNLMLEKIKGHYPTPIEDLVIDFESSEREHKLSYAAYASPKKWQERLKKVCGKLGITSLKFVPEPVCQMALYTDAMQEDAVLFSSHEGQVYISVFRNGLLYDSYLMASAENGDMMTDYHHELERIQNDFKTKFKTSIQILFFVGFEKSQHVSIKSSCEKLDMPLVFIDEKESALGESLSYEPGKATLFGLFNIVNSYDK